MKRALISVYDKDGIVDFAKFLKSINVEIISTGGTLKYLKENNIEAIDVEEVTGFPEMLEGRVKTLHPSIHGGILAKREEPSHIKALKDKDIELIDIVVVNLYPFFEKYKENITFEEKVEFIDIGGPTMLRAAAKNFKDVIVVSDKKDYKTIIEELHLSGDVSYNTRKTLAGKVFNLTSAYDGAISKFLLEDSSEYPEYMNLVYKKSMNLRYGENPHQKAAYYDSLLEEGTMNNIEILNGKELSYNNIKDLDIAFKVVMEFSDIACCALKHNSPCGVALGRDNLEAYTKAYECDDISIFGGVVAFNKKLDKFTAEKLIEIFLEIVVAPDFEDEALEVLRKKKNLRVIKCNNKPMNTNALVSVDGGLLVQEEDKDLIKDLEVVTKIVPTEEELKDMDFAMKVVKYVKSNAIVVAKGGKTLGIGGGQVNRIWAAKEALERGKGALVLASDAFFPFDDVVKEAASHGIKAIIQPGGSIKDKESITSCDELGISMVLTHIRHFKH
ncbi:bifunctional phosphoribosylaminoimidazolecarboxamide formyltransferase/IMP cyclohydrolase [Clostridium algidicarnis]|uniref:bifunctional phosphoribosylaminoimidazolecarboxamide formyltransferase/IMP cyclohydrolase n=1 Tax=Clostridium algidicarnis TaxID=37659 RepID=UPI001C0D2933|nr:bifunctional phosphoribosylaminoimidazolecarboxamide formyltransferase/IMP cyclohydrolase [Clostridium algidicarnis]MBU3195279.1 bifunctional phosphoribosylaminoimidazolecarboxamide formyltransferase/IMP cyclohydrolase [Clostridium algidicarnis]